MSEILKTSNNGQWSLEKRCWDGYSPTPGKKPYEKGSCEAKKVEVAPEDSNNKKTYLKEFKKSLESNDVEMICWNNDVIDILFGDEVSSEYEEYLTKYIEDSGYDMLEKKAWAPKAKHKSKSGGLTQAGVDSYKRANPGSKLQTAVTESAPKGKRAGRRRSFCARNKGQIDMHNIECQKTPEKRACLARKKWKCKN